MYFIILFLVAFYVFWHECKRIQKDNNSIFDVWILGSIFMLLWGRLSYITSRWDEFMSVGWFYSPYELYGDKIYWFRQLPWKMIAVWDGYFLFTGIFAGLLIFAYFYISYMKKWSWQEMYRVVFGTAYLAIVAMISIYSVLARDGTALPFIIAAGVLDIIFLTADRINKKLAVFVAGKVFVFELILSLVIFANLAVIFLQGYMTITDKVNLVIVLAIHLLTLYRYYKDVRKPSVSIKI